MVEISKILFSLTLDIISSLATFVYVITAIFLFVILKYSPFSSKILFNKFTKDLVLPAPAPAN